MDSYLRINKQGQNSYKIKVDKVISKGKFIDFSGQQFSLSFGDFLVSLPPQLFLSNSAAAEASC